MNLLEVAENEKITTVIEIPEFRDYEYLVMVTKYGVIKRTPVSEYSYQRRGGKIAINLDEGDELIFVSRTDGNCDVLIATRYGRGARFSEGRVSIVGRTARGVRGIKLKDDDYVVGAALIVNTPEWQEKYKLVTITENGFGKRTLASQFDAKGRGTQGIICHTLNDKTGFLCGIKVIPDDKDVLLITDTGIMIKTPVDGIPIYGRTASGVKIIKLVDNARVMNFAATEKLSDKGEDETEEGGAAAETAALEVSADTASEEIPAVDGGKAPYVDEGIDKLLDAALEEQREKEDE